MGVRFRFAHLSDWHATTLEGRGRDLLSPLSSFPKRLSGWASWRLKRRAHHSPAVLEAAIRDVHRETPDAILVTGDLTHVALESEFKRARAQLGSLGPPDRVFLIPGNHDCYVPTPMESSWDYWAPYLAGSHADQEPSDSFGTRVGDFAAASRDPRIAACLTEAPQSGAHPARAPRYEDFPTLRFFGRLAVVGLCSAIPVPVFRAGGALGDAQLARLGGLLDALEEHGFARVILIHHPVVASDESARRSLRDGAGLLEVLARSGADLVLHGHKHRRRVHLVPGPHAEIPIIGVPSSSEVGSRPDKRAQYHLFTIEGGAPGETFTVEAEVRGYDPDSGEFVPVKDRLF